MPSVHHVLMTADAVGGVWTYALALCEGLASANTRVTLAVLGPAPSSKQMAALATVPMVELVIGDFALEWMQDSDEDVRLSGEWLEELAKTTHPTIVHLNGYAHALVPFRAPKVVVAHSCVCSWWKAVKRTAAPGEFAGYRARVKEGLRHADAVVAPTHAMSRMIADEYGFSRSPHVIPNGLESDAASTVPKRPFIVGAGRFWDEAKNLQLLDLVAADLEWPVFIAGDVTAPDGRTVAPRHAHHLGRLELADVREWFLLASIYVLPARYEPFGLSVLEAAQSGCALVLGDIPTLRESWDGAALFVDPNDAASLRTAITSLIESHSLRRELGVAARTRSVRFRATRMTRSYLELYDELTEHSQSRLEAAVREGSPCA